MANRVSLTKAERASGIGAELLALCQAVTEDGYLSKDEIAELRRWLKDNRDAELPSISFLAETVERIVADRRITNEERRELYHAIELVLPPSARKEAIEARKEAESEREYRERVAKESARAAERKSAQAAVVNRPPREKPARLAPARVERRERPSERPVKRAASSAVEPLATSKFMVAGVHHQGRAAIVDQFANEGDPVFLARDVASPLSPHAIEVRLENGYVIGFVPEEDAQVLAPLLDEGCPHSASIKTIVTGGRVPVPVITSQIYEIDADVDDVVFPEDVPERAETTSGLLDGAMQSQVTWGIALMVVVGLGAAAYFLLF